MNRNHIRGLWALPLLLALTLVLTGCGSGDGQGGDNGVASADGSDSGGTRDANSGGSARPLSDEELHNKLLTYAKCLRDHGVEIQDPKPGEGLAIQEKRPGEHKDAMKACEDVAPPAPPEGQAEEMRGDMLEFATCMRDHGVEKFKDPKPGEGIDVGPDVVEDPDFKSADETCNKQIFGAQPQVRG